MPPLLKQDACDGGAVEGDAIDATGRPADRLIKRTARSRSRCGIWPARSGNQSIAALLGGKPPKRVPAYASSINWLDDATGGTENLAAVLKGGFREIKVRKPDCQSRAAVERAKLRARRVAGDNVALMSMPTGSMSGTRPCRSGGALADLGDAFFEEPIVPHDRAGYAPGPRSFAVRLAAGESDFGGRSNELAADRSMGLIQPDVAHFGGGNERPSGTSPSLPPHSKLAYAPHVGWSGGVCRRPPACSCAAAAETTRTFECMVYENPLFWQSRSRRRRRLKNRDFCAAVVPVRTTDQLRRMKSCIAERIHQAA